jgi:hypothetical protein
MSPEEVQSMERGRVLPDLAVSWLAGQMTAGVYFTLARRRATAAAGRMVHDLVAGDRRRSGPGCWRRTSRRRSELQEEG